MNQKSKYIYAIPLLTISIISFLSPKKCGLNTGSVTDQLSIKTILNNKEEDFNFFSKLRIKNLLLYDTLRVYHSFKFSGRYDLANSFIHPDFNYESKKNIELDYIELFSYNYDKSVITDKYAKLFANRFHTKSSDTISTWDEYEFWAFSSEDKKWYLLLNQNFGSINYSVKIDKAIKDNVETTIIK